MSARQDKPENTNAASTNGEPPNSKGKPECFVIMPISDLETYDAGHFGRVYEFIIKPACKAAGFTPIRADEVQLTNFIVIDILRKILEADMVLCDLSSRNPNVLYELGIRQAFNLPVTLIKDSRTPRIFDIQGLRDIEYEEDLRIDKIGSVVEALTNTLKNTYEQSEGAVNSLIQLLGVKPASAPSIEVSSDTNLLLDAINSIGNRLRRIEEFSQLTRETSTFNPRGSSYTVPQILKQLVNALVKDRHGKYIGAGTKVFNHDLGEGMVTFIGEDYLVVDYNGRQVAFDIKDNEIGDLTVIEAS